jgi:hypothetical protein
MVVKKESSEAKSLAEIEEMILAFDERLTKLENDRSIQVINQFEIWIDNKVRGFQYGPDLKKIVMPMSISKTMEEARKIFYTERDKLIKERYPGKPTPPWN